MQEKQIVNDVLSMVKSSLTDYTRAISECSNPQLRQKLQQIRNADEQFQFQLANTAIQKGYYQPAMQATDTDVQQVKSQFQG